jgi:hypothetical protein
VPDLFDVLFASYLQSKTSGLTALQSSSDQRITGATDRLAALEYRYERMHVVTVALWALLKEHTGLTDADLKRFVQQVEEAESKNRGGSATILALFSLAELNLLQ